MNFLTKFLAFLFIYFYSSATFSQTTVTLENFMSVFNPGSVHYYTNDEGNSYDIGQLGGPQIFDYSYISLQNLNVSNNYSISSIPILSERYPSDGITIGETPSTIEKNPVFLIRGDSVFVLGEASLVPNYRFNHHVPYELIGKFPATYSSSFNQNITTYDTTYNSNWQVISTNVSSSNEIVTIDAFGTLKLPNGEYECLRMKRDHTGYGDKEFIFITREGFFLDVFTSGTSADTGFVSGGFQLFLPPSFVNFEYETFQVTDFYLGQNYPNPFNPSTKIKFSVPQFSQVNIKVFDILGKKIVTLVNEQKSPGTYEVEWDAGNLPSGVYFYSLTFDSQTQSKKMLLLK